MCYDEEIYRETSEFDQIVDDLRLSLMQSVKKEFLEKMQRLEKENAELREVKRNWERLKSEYEEKQREQRYQIEQERRNVRRERLAKLFMQELDTLPNNVIVIGTTNRFDMLDQALVRRFPMNYQIEKLNQKDAEAMARKFLEYAGMGKASIDTYVASVCGYVPASTIIRDCTEYIAWKLMEKQ